MLPPALCAAGVEVGVADGDSSSDRARLAELFAADYQTLVGLARLLGDPAEAEDVVQSAFVGVCRRGRLRDPQLAGAYLRRSVVNGVRSRWRQRATGVRYGWVHPREQAPEADVLQRLVVRQALAGLPRRQREAVVLRYFADLSEKDTAQVMGVSVGSVKAYTSRGLACLGQLLARSER